MSKHQASMIVAIVFLLTVGSIGARADILLGTGNTALSGFTGPYANVHVALDGSGTTATVTFTSLTNGGFIYLMGDGGTADLNVNGDYTLVLGTVTETNSIGGFTPTFDANVPGQVDGFGVFNLSLNNKDGFQDTATTISFDLTKTTGTWSSAANVLIANANGALAAVHAYACPSLGCTTSLGAVNTGFAAGNGGPTPPQEIVPEPSSIALLGSLVFGLCALMRKRLSA